MIDAQTSIFMLLLLFFFLDFIKYLSSSQQLNPFVRLQVERGAARILRTLHTGTGSVRMSQLVSCRVSSTSHTDHRLMWNQQISCSQDESSSITAVRTF